MVTWDGLLYLVQMYWLFLAGAGAVGLVVGWLNFSPKA